MAKQRSAGILMFRRVRGGAEVLLVHPGGPFWAKKDDGAWSVPKGLYEDNEDALVAAKREFQEETGCEPIGEFFELGSVKQPSGKKICVWAVEGNVDATTIKSNLFVMEWPPKSGRTQEFPEGDRAGWFDLPEAVQKIIKGQRPILQMLDKKLGLRVTPVEQGERPQ